MTRNEPRYVLAFIALLCIIFGAAVATVHYSSAGLLQRNEALHRNRVLCRVFSIEPHGGSAEDFRRAVSESLDHITLDTQRGEMRAYRNRADGSLGFEFSGMGFWDLIEGVLVLNSSLDSVRGIRFTGQKETPGLGARIEEPSFTDQFAGLPLAWDAPADERIVIGPSAATDATRRVDAITGASQTSFALMKLLNTELQRFADAWKAHTGKDPRDG